MEHIAANPRFGELCRKFRFGYACTQSWSALADPAVAVEFRPAPAIALPLYTYDEPLRFTSDGNGRRYLGRGWSASEPWGTWSAKPEAEISLPLHHRPSGAAGLEVRAMGFVHAGLLQQEVKVTANGEEIALWRFQVGEGAVSRTATIPSRLIASGEELKLRFIPASPQSPKAAGLSNDDTRQLGIGLVEMTLSDRAEGRAPSR